MPDACKLFRGVLCGFNQKMDGREYRRYFYDLGVKTCDFLLPDQNYSYPSDLYAQPGLIPTYGVVLEEAYREWRRIDDPNFSIRLFDVLVRALLGTPPAMDCLGTTPVGIFTIASSGEIEPLDTFKCCGEEYTKTGRTVFDTDLMDLPLIPNLRTSLERAADLPADCLSCTYKDMCGGGYMPHRFKDGSFKNPSVYCADLKHICSVVSADIKAELGDIAAVLKLKLKRSRQMADEDSIEDVTVELKVSEMTMDELMKADLNHLIKSLVYWAASSNVSWRFGRAAPAMMMAQVMVK